MPTYSHIYLAGRLDLEETCTPGEGLTSPVVDMVGSERSSSPLLMAPKCRGANDLQVSLLFNLSTLQFFLYSIFNPTLQSFNLPKRWMGEVGSGARADAIPDPGGPWREHNSTFFGLCSISPLVYQT